MLYEYDGNLFEKNSEGKWICKDWAMRGPTGCMMDKEVPEPYQSKIESAFQANPKSRARRPTEPIEDKPEVKVVEKVKVERKKVSDEEKLILLKEKVKNKTAKVKEVGVKKREASSVSFNPFAKE